MPTDAADRVTVHVVPHTHWDREWYFTAEQSRVLLGEVLPVVLDELEQGRLPAFVLDGQSVLIEDYLALAPAERARVAALVRAGRLLVGPWYTQTDQCVVGAESLVRNLLYGTRDARALGGEPLAVGYVPDSFGQAAQLPQILQGFGIGRCIFWRGFPERVHPQSEFLWEAPDGSRVVTAAILSGYSGAKGMPDDAAAPAVRMAQLRHHVEYMRPFNAGPNVLVMAGNDQQPWDPRLPGILADENAREPAIEYLLSTPARFFDALEAGGALGVVRGEMLAARHGRIHRGIWSTRCDVKKANADAEKLLTLALEPVLAIGWSLGMPYPHGFLERAWKTLLKSHAHDSIGGCNSDEVNRAVKQRCLDVLESGEALLELRMRAIAERVRARRDGERVLLFNTLPERRRALAMVQVLSETSDPARLELRDGDGNACVIQPLAVETMRLAELVQDVAALVPPRSGDTPVYRHRLLVDAGELPALGYTTLYLRAAEPPRAAAAPPRAAGEAIENGLLRARLSDDGTLELTGLASGRAFAGLLELVDGGDDGDEYDFSPPRADWKVSTRGSRPAAEITAGPLQQSLRLRYALDVPRDLEERAARRASATLAVDVTLTLRAGEPFLRVTIALDNAARDHRLQVLFRTGLETDVSYAEQPFGVIERPSRPPELADWERAGWSSKPLPLYPMQGFVALADGKGGLGVLTDGLREYEIDTDEPGTLAVTLFRSVGVMGKPDLLYRPGRLSGMPLPTPEAQLFGPLSFRFALAPFAGTPSALAALARRYLADVPSFHASAYPRFALNRQPPELPDTYTLAEIPGPLVVSAVKKAEDREALLVRAFNPHSFPVAPGEVRLRGRPARPRHARLDETPSDDAAGGVPPQGVVTLLFDGAAG